MNENENRSNEEEEKKKKSETPKEEDPAKEENLEPTKPKEKAEDDTKADENGEGAVEDKPAEDNKSEEIPKDPEPKKTPDEKDEEILRLKTQITAMQSGIKADCVDDAVAIAESYVRVGKSADINSALSEVVKKYPEMKTDSKEEKSKSGGFKVGADSPKENSADDDKLDKAFGIRKKK